MIPNNILSFKEGQQTRKQKLAKENAEKIANLFHADLTTKEKNLNRKQTPPSKETSLYAEKLAYIMDNQHLSEEELDKGLISLEGGHRGLYIK